MTKYSFIKQIGKGGFSTVWLAENKVSSERVALKVVNLADPDLEPDEVASLLLEAKLLRSLDCPYLVRCFDMVATDEWLVMVLEYLSGGEMLDHITSVRKYTEAEAAKLFAQVVSAVSYLHNLNMMHRDIKPENVMFTQPVEQLQAEGRPLRVKMIDLGMSMLYDSNKEVRGCIGTPGFVAPELWNDKPHTPACDVYSLGVVLFIMLTGRKPHGGLDIRMMTYCGKSIKDAPGLKDERFLALSSSARELLLSMLADDPRDRPTCLAILQHAFITAVDSNMEAHREMGDTVRRRMKELAQLRRMHGLRYALRIQKPHGGDHLHMLEMLDQRRLKIKRGTSAVGRGSDGEPCFSHKSDMDIAVKPSFAWTCDSGFSRRSEGPWAPAEDTAGSDVHAPPFARSSLGVSYALQPAIFKAPLRMIISRSCSADKAVALGTTAPSTSGSAFGRGCAPDGPPSASGAASTRASATGYQGLPTSQASGQGHRAEAAAADAADASADPATTSVIPFTRESASTPRTPVTRFSNPPMGPALPLPPRPPQPPSAATHLFYVPGAAPKASLTPAMSGLCVGGSDGGLIISPDLQSHALGIPDPDGLAARPVGAEGGGSTQWTPRLHHVSSPGLDPMLLLNALPALHRCSSMNAAVGRLEGDDGMLLGGGSPVAPPEVLQHAVLSKCLSANYLDLQLLAHQASLERVLTQVDSQLQLGDPDRRLEAAATAGEAQLQTQTQATQGSRS